MQLLTPQGNKPENIHHELFTEKSGKTSIIGKIDEFSRKIKPNDGFILFVAATACSFKINTAC